MHFTVVRNDAKLLKIKMSDQVFRDDEKLPQSSSARPKWRRGTQWLTQTRSSPMPLHHSTTHMCAIFRKDCKLWIRSRWSAWSKVTLNNPMQSFSRTSLTKDGSVTTIKHRLAITYERVREEVKLFTRAKCALRILIDSLATTRNYSATTSAPSDHKSNYPRWP